MEEDLTTNYEETKIYGEKIKFEKELTRIRELKEKLREDPEYAAGTVREQEVFEEIYMHVGEFLEEVYKNDLKRLLDIRKASVGLADSLDAERLRIKQKLEKALNKLKSML